MKIAIHKSDSGFNLRWIQYCNKNKIDFKIVNCFDNDIIEQLKDCDALIWHHSQNDPRHLILAKPLLFALEQAGKIVFPDFKTNWHFDDKLGQKYLLEALDLPFVPSAVFYTRKDALDWIRQTTFPKVFKLRRGAGSANVMLVKDRSQANKLINKAFGKGFSNYNALGNAKEIWRKWRLGNTDNHDLLKGILHLAYPPAYSRVAGRESGYVYFQDFVPDNDHDIRVVVIGNKAFAIKRMVRNNDFRASGSGEILYEKKYFSDEIINLAFEINTKLRSQCTAMDFVFDSGKPLLVEISYGFVPEGYNLCPGYWDNDINWYAGEFDPYGWMIENVIREKEENSDCK